jgi:hypothetical protein
MKTLLIIHLYYYLGAYQGADHASGALVHIGRVGIVVSGLVKMFGFFQDVLIAVCDAETASLAIFRTYDDFMFNCCFGHGISA